MCLEQYAPEVCQKSYKSNCLLTDVSTQKSLFGPTCIYSVSQKTYDHTFDDN